MARAIQITNSISSGEHTIFGILKEVDVEILPQRTDLSKTLLRRFTTKQASFDWEK
jgi:hypothetical protein